MKEIEYPNDIIKAISELVFYETEVKPAELCICFGNDFTDTMKEVSELYHKGMITKKIILSGHSALHDREEPECLRFYKRGLELGIPAGMMLQESRSTNTKENLMYSRELIERELGGLSNYGSLMFVAKAFVLRRIEMCAGALGFPQLEYIYYPIVNPNGRNIGRDNWWKHGQTVQESRAARRVLEELGRLSAYTLKGDLSVF